MKGFSRASAASGVLVLLSTLTGCSQNWQTSLVSLNDAGTDSAAGWSGDGGLSVTPDGTKVVFASRAGDLGPTDSNGDSDIYVRDLVSGTTTLLSVNAAGTDSGNGPSENPQLSPDGTKVGFISAATDLGPTSSHSALYIRDLSSGTTSLVTVNGAGTDSSDGFLYAFTFSPDGTKLVWPTNADDLGPFDHDRPPYDPEPSRDADDEDLYVRDLVTGTTSLVSINAAGTDSGDMRTSDAVVFNDDGTKVRFHSAASDLVAGDTNGTTDAFERDLVTGTTSLLPMSPTASGMPIYSPDGSKAAYTTTANDLGPVDSDCSASPPPFPPFPRRCSDVYVRDVGTGTFTLVSVNAAGTDSANGDSTFLAFSADGSKVFFQTAAGNLGPADAGYDQDIYVRDLVAGTTSLVTVNADGSDGLNADNYALYIQFSPDMTKIAFGTMATNLGHADSNGTWDVYVRDLGAGITTLVSDNTSGSDTGNGQSFPGLFSPNGKKLVFTSTASNLVPTDTNGKRDVFVAALT